MFGRQVQRLKGLSRPRPLSSSSLNNLNILDYNPEVRDALEAKKAVVFKPR
jgi:hypothetical protein